jgi:hypothetical protein
VSGRYRDYQPFYLPFDQKFDLARHSVDMPVPLKYVARRNGFEHFHKKMRKIVRDVEVKIFALSRGAEPSK